MRNDAQINLWYIIIMLFVIVGKWHFRSEWTDWGEGDEVSSEGGAGTGGLALGTTGAITHHQSLRPVRKGTVGATELLVFALVFLCLAGSAVGGLEGVDDDGKAGSC